MTSVVVGPSCMRDDDPDLESVAAKAESTRSSQALKETGVRLMLEEEALSTAALRGALAVSPFGVGRNVRRPPWPTGVAYTTDKRRSAYRTRA
jgi:hypothetical protein